jgi:hypothetical protein
MAFEDLMKPIWEERFNPNEAKKTELTRWRKIKIFLQKIRKKICWFWQRKIFHGRKFTLADIIIGAALPGAVSALGLKDCL